jgi:hypothetical protein
LSGNYFKYGALRFLNRRRYTAAELAEQHGETPLSDEDRARVWGRQQ